MRQAQCGGKIRDHDHLTLFGPLQNIGKYVRVSIIRHLGEVGIDGSERRIADVLARTRTRIVQERSSDRTNRIGGSNTRSIIFFVSNYVTGSAEKDKIKIELEKMIKETPGINQYEIFLFLQINEILK